MLQLVFSYSLAGQTIPSTYNNQEDYIKQIPGLLNSAQTYLYQFKRIPECVRLSDLVCDEDVDGMEMYYLPDDCLRMKPGLLLMTTETRHRMLGAHLTERFTDYRVIGGNRLLVPEGLGEELFLEYEKRTVPVTDDVADSYVLENVDEVNECIPFYIAAHLVMYDDSFRYASLKNEFEDRLNRLALNPTYVEDSEVRDAYGPNPIGWW